jgi:hypothetical protein
MKHLLTCAAVIVFAAALTSAYAEERPVIKAPQKTMGDEGKLPATATVGSSVPNMGAAPSDEADPNVTTGPRGTVKRLGDEGTLPATSTMSRSVPEMTGPDGTVK